MAPDQQIDRVRDEYIARLLKRYESRSDTLSKLLNGLLLFALLFFFLILFPFVSLKHQNHRLASELERLAAQGQALDSTLAAYTEAEAGLQRLKEAIAGGPQELRAALMSGFDGGPAEDDIMAQNNAPMNARQAVQQALPAPSQQAPMIGAASMRDCPGEVESTEWMNCQVRGQVERQFAGYTELLESSVIRPLQARHPAADTRAVAAPDSIQLRQNLEKLQVALQSRLDRSPNFWERFSGKVSFYSQLSGEVDRFWSESGLEMQESRIRRALLEVQGRQRDSRAELEKLTVREGVLAGRLEKMESPFGKLPLGLLEGVHLFPLLLIGGFLICIAIMGEVAGVRAALHQAYQERDPTGAVLTPQSVAFMAPLWIDPLAPSEQRRARWLVLLTTPLIALVAVALVLYVWSIAAGSDLVSGLESMVYGVLYLLCAAAAGYGWRQAHHLAGPGVAVEERRGPPRA